MNDEIQALVKRIERAVKDLPLEDYAEQMSEVASHFEMLHDAAQDDLRNRDDG